MKKMQVTVKINPKLISDVMSNFPEASLCLQCVAFDYKKCEFEFWDQEVDSNSAEKSIVPAKIQDMNLRISGEVKNAVTYKVTKKELEKGLLILANKIGAGELPGLGLGMSDFNDDDEKWDAFAADALVQCAIFGDVIYG